MSRPFVKKAVDAAGQRLLGFTLETNEPLWAPSGHSLLLAAAGSGKTTCGAMVWLYSFAASEPDKAILCLDSKNGEMAIQAAEMLAKMGRKVAVVDDMGVWTDLEAYRISLNPFGAAVSTYRRDPRDMIFTTENITNAAIKEPPDGDAKNIYFRAWPRNLIEFCILLYAKRQLDQVIPGGVSMLLSHQKMMLEFAEIEAEEGDPYLKGLAQSILAMASHEHWPQHLEEAQRAMKVFAPGTRLHMAGRDANITHEQLIREGYVIFLIGPQAYMNRLGVYYALHMLAFAEALYNDAGPLRIIADEFTNCPLQSLVEMLTTLRGFGAELHIIAQSRSEIVRRFGEKEAETIADNAVVQIWYGVSSLKEAQMISDMMGEEHAVSTSLGRNDDLKLNTNISLIKQRILSPAELLAMPSHVQLIYVKGLGFLLARKVGMQNVAPFCHEVGMNRIESGTLAADPWITFTTNVEIAS
ncbi:TraM recognition domain-containing protein [Tateyamaria sp. ANG-S1]|uniref:type IV secretory system conjugative DNA transfer family protein n=1 Tax=Tateyamaria sp. ANG-S1 TaxID=1577905 RepID=UPI000689E7DF|nr:TraM recognition domain-containing protein [Tateyamaria sp. ANG-S1]